MMKWMKTACIPALLGHDRRQMFVPALGVLALLLMAGTKVQSMSIWGLPASVFNPAETSSTSPCCGSTTITSTPTVVACQPGKIHGAGTYSVAPTDHFAKITVIYGTGTGNSFMALTGDVGASQTSATQFSATADYQGRVGTQYTVRARLWLYDNTGHMYVAKWNDGTVTP